MPRNLPPNSSLALVVCMAIAGACDAQVGSDYLGEPLAIVQGTVSAEGMIAPSDAVLAWGTEVQGRGAIVTQSLGHTPGGQFPTSFELKLFVPPPPSGMFEVSGENGQSHVGIANIIALPEGKEIGTDCHNCQGPTGVVEDHVIVYADRYVAGADIGDWFLASGLEQGFHIMHVVRMGAPGCPSDVSNCLEAAADGMATTVELRIGEDLEFPRWN